MTTVSPALSILTSLKDSYRLVKWHKKREMAFFMIFYILGKA